MYKMGILWGAWFCELFNTKIQHESALFNGFMYVCVMITRLDYYTKEISFCVPGVYLYR